MPPPPATRWLPTLPRLLPIPPLPLLTRLVIGLSEAMQTWGWLAILLMVLAGVGATVALRNPATRLKADTLALKLPIVGRLSRDLREHRKPPLVLVRRGFALMRDQQRVVGHAVRERP